MATKTKLAKGWTSCDAYRCYVRPFGPLTCRVQYSCVTESFKIDVVSGYDSVLGVLFCAFQPDENVFDDFDAEVLKMAERSAKWLIRKWSR